MSSIESKLDSLLDVYRQVLQKGPSALTLSSLPLFELNNHQRHSSDYQTSILSRDLPSPQEGDPIGGENHGGINHSLSVNTRGLRLILAPADDDDPPDSAPPSYPPSTASLSPSPLLPPDSPYPNMATPNISKRAHFPDLPPPPSSGASFTLQLPPILHPSQPHCPIEPTSNNQGTMGPSVVVRSPVEGDTEPGSAQEETQLHEKPGLKSEGVWRRHINLEVNPLLPCSPSPDETPSDWEECLGKSFSAHNLCQPSFNRAQGLSSDLHNSSSSSHSSKCVNPHGGLSNWDEAELVISHRKLNTEPEHFNFLTQEPGDSQHNTFRSPVP